MTVNSVPHDGEGGSILASQSLLPWLENIPLLDNIFAGEFTGKHGINFPAPDVPSDESERQQ